MSDPVAKKCTVCGETDPYPAWFCLPKAMMEAKRGQPCSYSVEGSKRWKKKATARLAEITAPTEKQSSR